MRTLRQCLIDLDLVRLRLVARLWGLEVAATRQLDIVDELTVALGDRQHQRDAWAALPPAEQEALKALLQANGMMPTGAFERQFGPIRPIGPGRLEREKPWRDPAGPAEGLWYRGWIYKGFREGQTESYEVVFVPQALQAGLSALAEESPADEDAPADQGVPGLTPIGPPADVRPAGDLFLDDVTTVLAFVQNEKPAPASIGAWPQRAYLAVSPSLRLKEVERTAFVSDLIDHLGWTHVDGESKQLRLVAEPVLAWLRASPAEQRRILVDAWRETTTWNELWRLTSIQPDDTGTWRNDPSLAREALLQHLATLEAGEWYLLADFIADVKAKNPDFQRPGGVYDTWYIRDAFTGLYLMGFESWDKVEGALLAHLLTRPAWWLGLVDLGASDEGGAPAALRLTPAGAEVVGLAPESAEPEPAPEAGPAVHPNLTISIPSTLRFDRFQLARVADLVEAGEPYVYRLTPGSLTRARSQGISVAKALDFLSDLNGGPLPTPVRSSTSRWASQGTEVRLQQTVLLRVANEELLQQIVTSPKTRRYVGQVVGPKAAAVAERDWPRLLAALAEMGLMADLVDL